MTRQPFVQQKLHHQAMAGQAVITLSGMILQELHKKADGSLPVRITAGVIARAIRTTSSIHILIQNHDLQSAWVLHRTLAERLFHLHHLAVANDYDAFEEWSFFEQMKAQQSTKTDPLMSEKASGPDFEMTPEQTRRFKAMLKNPPAWRRPKALDIAKTMGFKFIYDHAYNYGSTMIHPMANDGEIDLPGVQSPEWIERMQTVLLENTLLIMTLILQAAMNSPPLNWCKAAYDAVDATRSFIHQKEIDYATPTGKFAKLIEAGAACAAP